MDIFCLPSYANEGVPQAILQAMFTGLPVISTPIGSITEIIADRHTGLIVQPHQAKALAEAIGCLQTNHALENHISTTARTNALERFTYGHMIERMGSIFHQTIKKHR